MLYFIRILTILVLVQLIFLHSLSAWEIKDRNEYLWDVRGDDGDMYLNRISLNKKINNLDFKLLGFGEGRWNFDISDWEKLEAGIAIEKSILKYLYISQSVQLISGQILDHMAFDIDSCSFDTTTILGLRIPFFKNYVFRLLQNYSVNLEQGTAGYCETISEVLYNLNEFNSLSIGWRHTDRIHNFDTDYISTSFSLRF